MTNKPSPPAPLFITPISFHRASSLSTRIHLTTSRTLRQSNCLPRHHARSRPPSFIHCIPSCSSEAPPSSSPSPSEDSDDNDQLPPSSTSDAFSTSPSLSSESDQTASSPPPPQSQPSQPIENDISVSTAVSSAPTLNEALAEAASRSLANLSRGGPPNLAILYVSVRYSVSNTVGPSGRHSIDLVVPRLRGLIPTLTAVLGCTVDGVIGSNHLDETVEVEHAPAISLTLLRLPRITITPFHIMPDDLPSLDALQHAWHAAILGAHKANSNKRNSNIDKPTAFLVFSDPTFASRGELDRFLEGVEYAYPGSSVAGALASAAATFANGHMICTLPRDVLGAEAATSLHDSGLVGVALSGDIELDCLLSPGCRAIGPEFEVRKVGSQTSTANTILELEIAGRPSTCLPASGQLKSIISYATPAEKSLLQDRLYIGVSVDDDLMGADINNNNCNDNMLIRHVINVDMAGGGITFAVLDVRAGQRVRFFILERETAAATLNTTMQKYKRVELANNLVGYSNPPFGAMVFADVARGQGAFGEHSMETKHLGSVAKGVPVGGAFSGGQIGPLGSGKVDGGGRAAVLHIAANLVALMRRRSGMSS